MTRVADCRDTVCRLAGANRLIALYLEHGETRKALSAARTAEVLTGELEEKHPERIRFQVNRGAIAFAQGDDRTAIAQYEAAWQAGVPEPEVVLSNWALALARTGDIQQAIDKLERSRSASDNPVILGNLATAYAMIRHPSAEAMFQRAIALAETRWGRSHPHTAQLVLSYSALLELQGQHRESKRLRVEADGHLEAYANRELLGLTVDAQRPARED